VTLSRLKLISSHGDQTLPRLRFVLHVAPSAEQVADLVQRGLQYAEGRPSVLTDLTGVFEEWPQGSQGGKVFVLGVPTDLSLGYGVFTTAYIDRSLKHVVGAPFKYADARQHLAFYTERDTEAARERVEAEVAEGYELDQRPTFRLDPHNIVGFFNPTPAFQSLVGRVQVALDAFQPVEFEILEQALTELFRPAEPSTAVLASSIVDELLVATIEARVMRRLRMMRWHGLKLLGYEFFDGERVVEVKPTASSVTEQLQHIDSMQQSLDNPALFTGQLAWLKQYVATELRIMRVELDEAL
jgi:hypothetical protein